ncbi:hypothetical protein [Cesiribacter sp. SM1]|uniref:hypothetical protein n=1 Tax=Cesiribacter sp. SM1 TaxID=2861196 RepID=UPI001CD1FCAB|nr:hypothetical protein [Cesiribacter sp. SM1]
MANNVIKIRYDIEKAEACKVKFHPQMVMMDMAYKPTKFIADRENNCWIFEVEQVIEPLPPYLSVEDQ